MAAIEPDTVSAIQQELEKFVDECHSVFICHVSAVKSMEANRDVLDRVFEANEPVSIATALPDGSTRVTRTSVLGAEAAELFSSEGRFELLQAKSLVISIFAHWDSVTRPRIASLLDVGKTEDVESELMGAWRLLRNWLVHRDGNAEKQFFRRARPMAQLLNSRPGTPEITTQGVLLIMERLQSLAVIVNPNKVEPFVKFPDLTAEQRAKLLQGRKPNEKIVALWHQGL